VEIADTALEHAVPVFFREEPPIHPPGRRWTNLYCRCQWTASQETRATLLLSACFRGPWRSPVGWLPKVES